jgi:hypothetical protein
MNSKVKNISDMYRGKKGYQSRSKPVKDKNGGLPGSNQIPEELIPAGGETVVSENHKLINTVWNKEELPDQWKEPTIVSIFKKGDKTAMEFLRSFIQYPSLKIKCLCRRKYWVSSVWVLM